mgnify:CR=1 FL=1
MNDNLGQQFKWIPNLGIRHMITNHILSWHMKGQGDNNLKGMSTGGMTAEDLHNLHMEYHKNNEFDEGKEHKHFEPKEKK